MKTPNHVLLWLVAVILSSCTQPSTLVPYRSEQMIGSWHVIQDNRTGYDSISQSYYITISQDSINNTNAVIQNFGNCSDNVKISVNPSGSLHIIPSDTVFFHGHGYLFSEPIQVESRINDNNNWFELQYTMVSVEDSILFWNGWLFVEKL